jgi:Domain of unknown function (DUF4440)
MQDVRGGGGEGAVPDRVEAERLDNGWRRGGQTMKRWIVFTGLMFAAIAWSALESRAMRPDTATEEVLAAETARTTAFIHGDMAALDMILGDDLTYVHASGKVDTKASLVESIRSGQVHYISWETRKMHARVVGDSGVIDGEYHVRVSDSRVQADPLDVEIFILGVYARRSGHWQLIAWQSTRNVAAAANR